jgi:dienelactone hydrolase
VLANHISDARICVDVLCDRGDVDSARLGCLGNSYGGRIAMYLSIFDQRIKACVASGCANLFRERTLKLKSCGVQCPFGLLEYGDVGELFSLVPPRSMQILVGELDELMNPADRDSIIEKVLRAYGCTGGLEGFDYALHPGGHRMVWEEAHRYLKAQLPTYQD